MRSATENGGEEKRSKFHAISDLISVLSTAYHHRSPPALLFGGLTDHYPTTTYTFPPNNSLVCSHCVCAVSKGSLPFLPPLPPLPALPALPGRKPPWGGDGE
eukprot:Hpha_TRINITY_DN15056_c0_g21::TRINITY_DN15056_c0_g21_i1::g.126163::m.126163